MESVATPNFITGLDSAKKMSLKSKLYDDPTPRYYNSITETPTINPLYEGKYFSPWLSKPRKAEKSDKIPCRSSTSFNNVDANSNHISRKMTKENHHRFDYDTKFKIEILKQALECLGVEPSSESWQMICKILKVDDATPIKFSAFMKEVRKKDILRMELDFNGVTREQLFCTAFSLSDISVNNNHSVLLSVLSEKIIKLREENKVLMKEVDHLKTTVEEKTNVNDELEQEIAQLLEQKNGLKSNSENSSIESSETSEATCSKEREFSTTGTQTDVSTLNMQKRLSALSKRLHRSEFNYHLYKIATEKLLQFTKIVHEVLTDGKHLNTFCKESNRTSYEPKTNGECSNHMVQKDGGGKVFRTASVCTMEHPPNKKTKQIMEGDGINSEHLQKLAAKAKKIVISIQDVLQDDKECCAKAVVTKPVVATETYRPQIKHVTTSNEIKSSVEISDGKKVIWV